MMNNPPSQRWLWMKFFYLIPVFVGTIWLNSSNHVIIQEEGKMPVEILKFIAKHIKYPASALEQGIEGKVMLEVAFDKDGNIHTLKILKGIAQPLNDEALRVVREIPKWEKGNNKNTKYIIPIDFKLNIHNV